LRLAEINAHVDRLADITGYSGALYAANPQKTANSSQKYKDIINIIQIIKSIAGTFRNDANK
jgi:hypothetical protein